MYKQKQQKGFTLMEVLVSMSIFVIFTMAILGIHSMVLRASQRTIAYNRIQQESQVIMQTLSKKIRTSRVDYDSYAGGSVQNPSSELVVQDLTGTNYSFRADDGSLLVGVDTSGGNSMYTYIDMPADNVSVSDANFYVYPATSPFDINTPPETQPRVTLIMTFTSSKGGQQVSHTVQQTVPQLSGGVVD